MDNNQLTHPISDANLLQGQSIHPWGNEDYLAELAALATSINMNDTDCARRYGTFTLCIDSKNMQGWHFHPALGFCRKQD